MTIASLCLPFVDLHVNITEKELNQLGFAVGDDQMIDYEYLNLLVQQLKDDGQFMPGGANANALSVVSALGGKTLYFGKTANDRAGELFTGDLRARGVQYNPLVTDAEGTAICLVFVTEDGERTMVFNPGIASSLRKADIQANEEFLENAKIILTGLAYPMKDFKSTVDFARSKAPDAHLALTLQTYKSGQTELASLFKQAKIVIGNEDEFAALCKDLRAKDITDLTERQPHIMFVRTLGAKGAEIYIGAYQDHILPFIAPDIVNTTGAGDAFAGGLVYGLAYGHSLYDSALIGSYAAAQVLAHPSGRLPHGTQLNAKTAINNAPKLGI